MTETVCARRKIIRVCGADFPAEVVKSQLLKLDAEQRYSRQKTNTPRC